ncbi:hypothetical protein EZV73_02700 [Acidaminobacter sp. JC074]|uniref:hypothetical protein n=1 Tax=Acidaminobacter sp. JC074 TaxID=2530199 RepID=UPI001F0D6578|nr:hypothetical protein [Acidaminobacter sp. JC074]MCH4886456.1 hypothetical protein [Acidaminobacter sp. JC074]
MKIKIINKEFFQNHVFDSEGTLDLESMSTITDIMMKMDLETYELKGLIPVVNGIRVDVSYNLQDHDTVSFISISCNG